MNLQEQINRTKELMGLQPLNEGIFKKTGKFLDIFKRKKHKNKKGKVVAEFIPPSEIPEDKYDTKYGNIMGDETYVEVLTQLYKSQVETTTLTTQSPVQPKSTETTSNGTETVNSEENTKSVDFKENFINATIHTVTVPHSLPSDPTKKVNTKAFLVNYQEREGNEFYRYQYFKIYYFIDNKITDILSEIQEDGQQTCATNTLEGKNGNCEFTSQIKSRILSGFKDNSQIQAFLDRIY